MTDQLVNDYLIALERETPCAPAWSVGDLGQHPTMGHVVIAVVDTSGAFPRYFAVPCDRHGLVTLFGPDGGWVSGAFLS